MFVERLRATHFRNLRSIDLEFPEEGAVFEGANAQGKTNILEALYVAATARSFRSTSPADLIEDGYEHSSISALIKRDDVRHQVDVSIKPKRKQIRVDDRALKGAGKLLQLLNVVAFFPDDLHIVKGSPEGRRRFLDRAVANHQPKFYEAAVSYQRVLRSRNALLKSKQPVDETMLSVYDQQLIEFGTQLHHHRHAVLEEISPVAQRIFSDMMPLEHGLQLELISGLKQDVTTENFADVFTSVLKENAQLDRIRGVTTRGPHRADLAVQLDQRDARSFASQGQQRTVVLSLKLAEVETLQRVHKSQPVLLLDDVSSELDAERTARLFEVVQKTAGQVWLSTTGNAQLPSLEGARHFRVENGQVVELTE
jgi:DNA replication and repair protein RecF